MSLCVQEIRDGRRFEFGKNWQRFLSVLDEERIRTAEQSLHGMLDCNSLSGKRFLDVGSGSGLFSLAARRSGARVHSFDYDPQSVACALELKRHYFPSDPNWTIEQGSILDIDYVRSVGQFDIVYSWGVLHHTGAMWQAIENITLPVAQKGVLWIAIYNDQGWISNCWRRLKQLYCSGTVGQLTTLTVAIPYFVLGGCMSDLLKRKNPILPYLHYKNQRGMSVLRDWQDWLGGYPFEVARPLDVVSFYNARGFAPRKLISSGASSGNNEFVFERRG